MYAMGEGVPADIVRAHMWFNLAGAHTAQEHTQVRDAQKMRDMIASKNDPRANHGGSKACTRMEGET
jgi:hypothetical protein